MSEVSAEDMRPAQDEIEPGEYTGPIIHLQLSTDYDARGHHEYVKAPDNWDTMTPSEQEAFLDEEAQTWMHEHVEAAATVYASHEEAEEQTQHQWGGQYSPDQLEERF